MIIDAIIDFLLAIPYFLLLELDTLNIDLSFPDEVFNAFSSMVTCIDYILPMPIFLICFGVRLTVRFWALPYTIILKVKSFIPTFSD